MIHASFSQRGQFRGGKLAFGLSPGKAQPAGLQGDRRAHQFGIGNRRTAALAQGRAQAGAGEVGADRKARRILRAAGQGAHLPRQFRRLHGGGGAAAQGDPMNPRVWRRGGRPPFAGHLAGQHQHLAHVGIRRKCPVARLYGSDGEHADVFVVARQQGAAVGPGASLREGQGEHQGQHAVGAQLGVRQVYEVGGQPGVAVARRGMKTAAQLF